MKKSLPTLILLGLLVPVLGSDLQADDAAVVAIPFKLCRGYLILVKGSIGPLKDLNLVIDTGVSSTLISPRLARKLGLDGKAAQASSYGDEIRARRVILDDLVVGTVGFRRIPAIISDISRLPYKAGEADALVGLSVLKRRSFRINYAERKMYFGYPARLESSCPFTSEQHLIVRVEICGLPLNLLIDTGAEGVLLFRGRIGELADELVWEKRKRSVVHAGGEVRARLVRLRAVRLGDSQWSNLEASVLPGDAEGYSEEIHGVLGIRGLGMERVSLDFQQRVFGWEQ